MLAGFKFWLPPFMGAALTILPAAAENGRDVMDRVYKQSDVFSQSEAEVRLLVVDKRVASASAFSICGPKAATVLSVHW